MSIFVLKLRFPLLLSRVPFNWRTPQGYLMFSIFNAITSVCTVFSTVPTTCYYVGSCWLFIAMAEDIDGNFCLLIDSVKMESSDMQLRKQLCDFIRVYTEVKQLSANDFRIISINDIFYIFCSFWNYSGLLANSTDSLSSKF